MKAIKPKFNYKIFNKKTNKFISINRKSTWIKKSAVIDFVKNNTDPCCDYYDINELEIYIIPLANAIVKSASEFLFDNEDEIKNKEAKLIDKKKKRELALKEYKLKELELELKNTQAAINRLKTN